MAEFAKVRRELEDSAYVPLDSNITVGEYITGEWLPAIEHTIEASTFESYERNLRLHVTPLARVLKLRDLRASYLDTLYAELLASGDAANRRRAERVDGPVRRENDPPGARRRGPGLSGVERRRGRRPAEARRRPGRPR